MEGPIGISMILMGLYLFWEPSYGRAPEPTGKVAPRKSGMTSEVGAAVMASVKPNFVPRRGQGFTEHSEWWVLSWGC